MQKLINYLNSTDEVKNTLNLIKTLLFIILYIHVTGCIWFYIVNKERLWFPTNWMSPNSHSGGKDYFNDEEMKKNFVDQFFIAIYAALMSLFGNDIMPTTGFEMFVATCGLLSGSIMHAYIMGNLVVLV